MKQLIITSLVFAMVVGLGIALADKPADDTTGNGSPKVKKLYQVNLIGMANPKNVDPDTITSNGRRIFVKLGGKTRILLREGEFDVIDSTELMALPHSNFLTLTRIMMDIPHTLFMYGFSENLVALEV